MFTGIVTDIGEVIRVEKRGDTRFTNPTPRAAAVIVRADDLVRWTVSRNVPKLL